MCDISFPCIDITCNSSSELKNSDRCTPIPQIIKTIAGAKNKLGLPVRYIAKLKMSENERSLKNEKDGSSNNNIFSDETQLSPSVMLPVVSVGAILLAILCLAFCCYLMRLKKHNRMVRGYKKVVVNKKSKETCLEMMKTDTCAICLEEFKNKQVLAVCPCAHVYHKNCLVKWLKHRSTCPMCMAQVTTQYHSSYMTRNNRSLNFNPTAGSPHPPAYAGNQV